MLKIGDLVVPVTREWNKRRYTILDIFISEKTGDRLIQVGYIGNMATPMTALIDERVFELAPGKEES